MIEEIPKHNPMRQYATHWCILNYNDDIPFNQWLHETFAKVNGIDGNEWEEVMWTNDSVEFNREFKKTPTEGKDWYFAFGPKTSRGRAEIYLTKETQATYFSLVETDKFPSEEDDAASILQKIRTRNIQVQAQQHQMDAQAQIDKAIAWRSRSGPRQRTTPEPQEPPSEKLERIRKLLSGK